MGRHPAMLTGQTYIPELGLYHYKARFYAPELGRFLQTDPIGYEDQMNLYAYVGNDPVNGTDPSGNYADCGTYVCPWRDLTTGWKKLDVKPATAGDIAITIGVAVVATVTLGASLELAASSRLLAGLSRMVPKAARTGGAISGNFEAWTQIAKGTNRLDKVASAYFLGALDGATDLSTRINAAMAAGRAVFHDFADGKNAWTAVKDGFLAGGAAAAGDKAMSFAKKSGAQGGVAQGLGAFVATVVGEGADAAISKNDEDVQ